MGCSQASSGRPKATVGQQGWETSESCSVLSDSLPDHGLYRPVKFSRPEYWSGWPFPSPGNPPNPGIEPGSPDCRQILYHLSQQGSPRVLEWVAYPFSSRSSQPRNRTGVSCITGGFFTSWATRESPGWKIERAEYRVEESEEMLRPRYLCICSCLNLISNF